MEAQPDGLRALLRQLASDRSHRSISLAAGLNRNFLGDVLAGKATPRHEHLLKLLDVLNATPEQREQAIRLAGYHFEPGQSAEDHAARRQYWTPLFHVAVNQLLLPRGALPETERGRSPAASWPELDDALRLPMSAFRLEYDDRSPSREAMDLVESSFSALDTRMTFQLAAFLYGDLSGPPEFVPGVQQSRGSGFDWLRARIINLLSPFGLRQLDAAQPLIDALDPVFAAAIFPRLLMRAGRAWPFARFQIRLSRRGTQPQELLWQAIHDGASQDEIELALCGRGPLGTKLTSAKHQRPSIERFAPFGVPFGFGRTRLQGTGEYDAVYDHIDRCEFIDKFALVRAAPAWAVAEARLGASGPFWNALEEHVRISAAGGGAGAHGPFGSPPHHRDGIFKITTKDGQSWRGLVQFFDGRVSLLSDVRESPLSLATESIAQRSPALWFVSMFETMWGVIRIVPDESALDDSLSRTHVVQRILGGFTEGVRNAFSAADKANPW